jgi:hypothetical protein
LAIATAHQYFQFRSKQQFSGVVEDASHIKTAAGPVVQRFAVGPLADASTVGGRDIHSEHSGANTWYIERQ